MCPRGRPQGQGRPRGLHLCLIPKKVQYWLILDHWQYPESEAQQRRSLYKVAFLSIFVKKSKLL